MESFHIFKPCGDHLVAHLYEHLVMQTMHRQLFQAIDYQAYGIVYSDAGVMGIDVTLYTMQAERFVAQLRQPVAEYDDAMIDCALRQIIAEKGYPLTYHDRLALHEALHQLDTEPWYDAQDIDVLHCLGETAPRGIITQREEWEADVMEYTIDISIDLERPSSLSSRMRSKPIPLRSCSERMGIITTDMIGSARLGTIPSGNICS